ncbi:hypothetical protein ACH5AJ_36480 [Streptomyces rochei]|uniref:hypothetical protein n=1 Tax=Streptomyces rochei TaxID=1928 RepID=UPI0037A186DF
MARERVEFDVIGRDTSGSKAFRQVGDAAEKAGDQVEDLGKKSTTTGEQVEGLGDKTRRSGDDADGAGDQYRGLAHEIEQTRARMRALAEEIDRTGNKDLTKDLRRQQTELRQLTRIQDLLPDDAGPEIADNLVKQLVAGLGQLPAALGPVGPAVGGALAATAVPILASAIQGGVVGAVGIGGVIGGVTLASRDARVKAAGKQLGENMLGDLEDSATRFVDPTIAGITSIQAAWDDVSGDIDGALAAAAAYVEPLADGVADFMRELAPGLRDAAEAAEPIVAVVRDELPQIGAELSDLLSDFSEDADAGATAVRWLFDAIELGIGSVSAVVTGLGSMYRALVQVGDAGVTVAEAGWGWLPGVSGRIDKARTQIDQMKAGLEGSGEAGGQAGEKIAGGLQKVDDQAAAAQVKVESLAESLSRMAGENISAEQANIQLEEAIDGATEAAARNGATLDVTTPKGRANRAALIGIAEAASRSAEAVRTQTGSQELAADASERGRAAFLRTAASMGVSAKEANKLADQLFGIPAKRTATVTVNTKQAEAAVSRIKARLAEISRRIGVNVVVNAQYSSYGGGKGTGSGYSTGQRWGGAYVHAQTGLVNLRDAGIFPAAAPARYAFAEPATGGEAFIPRFGDARRSMDILTEAAGWYGQAVVPAGGRSGGAQSVPAVAGADADAVGRAVAQALAGMTLVLDDRTGRTATLMARGV